MLHICRVILLVFEKCIWVLYYEVVAVLEYPSEIECLWHYKICFALAKKSIFSELMSLQLGSYLTETRVRIWSLLRYHVLHVMISWGREHFHCQKEVETNVLISRLLIWKKKKERKKWVKVISKDKQTSLGILCKKPKETVSEYMANLTLRTPNRLGPSEDQTRLSWKSDVQLRNLKHF